MGTNQSARDFKELFKDEFLEFSSIKGAEKHAKQFLDAVCNLVSDQRMKNVWLNLSKSGGKEETFILGIQKLCLQLIINWWQIDKRPMKEKKALKREFLKWIKNGRNLLTTNSAFFYPGDTLVSKVAFGLTLNRILIELEGNILIYDGFYSDPLLEKYAGVSAFRQKRLPTAQQTYLIRGLTAYFRKRFGRPFREEVATIASVLFRSDVTTDNVKFITKDASKKPRTKLPIY